MATVETRGVTKTYRDGDVPPVHDVHLSISDGEFVVFLGPSGSGKSTLLRIIAGLESPSSGDVLIGGKVVTDVAPRARGIAMVFQSYALYPHLTVEKNIAFPLKAHGVPKETRRERVRWAARLLAIDHLLDRKPRELSGGERQRVALARALVREPAVFLLDEPLSNLDAKLRATARDELAQLHARLGTTTIYVTHDQVEAMSMGDRIVVLQGGVVRQVGTPREVYDRPADTFVATFLGSPPMNLVEDGDFVAGFRPESLRPRAGVAEPSVAVPIRVASAEYLGPERIVRGVVGEGPFAGRIVTARLPAAVEVAPSGGAVLELAIAERDLHFFDRASGKRTGPRPLPR